MILSLKRLNKNMPYIHFKMETVKSILTLVTPNCYIYIYLYMAKVDIKDVYYFVPILPEHYKNLKFYFRGKFYQFLCLKNGLRSTQIYKITKTHSFRGRLNGELWFMT